MAAATKYPVKNILAAESKVTLVNWLVEDSDHIQVRLNVQID